MIPKFNAESLGAPAHVEYVLPTKVENDAQLEDYYQYLKSIGQGEGIGSITEQDLDIFYNLFSLPQKFSKMKVEKLFGLLSHLASAECFQDQKVARECLAMIETYRTELSL